MRKITVTREDTNESRDIKIRPLKRKEIRALTNCGYNYLGCVPAMETAQEAVDQALNMVMSEDDLAFIDECPTSATQDLWRAVLKETYGSKDEEKNSSATTSGTLTETE
jgi:hypothetical protein